MNEIKLLANAKVNLALDITGKRLDGYHLMDMVMRSIDLCDELTVSRGKENGITLRSNVRYLPTDSRNLAVSAAQKLFSALGKELPPINMYLKKCIPSQAGLGGGSADAAAALVGANELFSLGLSRQELCEIGESVGADVPFCLVGGAARVSGIGENIRVIDDKCEYTLVILMPSSGHSTREAFAAFDALESKPPEDVNSAEAALACGDTSALAIRLCNAFSSLSRNDETERLKKSLLDAGALGACMTGSGAAVFGVFADALSARKAREKLRTAAFGSYLARPAASGVEIIVRK